MLNKQYAQLATAKHIPFIAVIQSFNDILVQHACPECHSEGTHENAFKAESLI